MSEFNSLTIKKLKHILLVKSLEIDSNLASTVKNTVATAVEKETLITLCNQYIDPSDIDRLSNKSLSDYKSTQTTLNASTSKNLTSNKSNALPKMDEMRQRAEQLSSQSPDQLRYQAACMRRDPNFIRRSSPEYEKLSDAQIFQMADQMEQLASNPDMLKQVSEQMKNMTPEQYEAMHQMQQSQSSSPLPTNGDLLDHQLESFIKSMRDNPTYARNFVRSQSGMSHLSDANIDEQLKIMKQIDPSTLKDILKFVQYVQQKSIPLQNLYKRVDKVTGGRAKYIVIAILVIVALFMLKVAWMVINGVFAWWYSSNSSTSTSSADFVSTSLDTNNFKDMENGNDDEFEF
jgi:hypothetical protein